MTDLGAALRPADLLDAVLALRVPVIVEHSVRIVPGAVHDGRILVGFPKAALGDDGLARLLAFADALGMPAGLAAVLRRDYAAADVVHAGLDGGGRGSEVVKIYLEFAEAAARADAGPTVVHRAVKWDRARTGSGTVSTYRSVPAASRAALVEQVVRALTDDEGAAIATRVVGLVDQALARVPAEALMLLEVEDAGTPRRSIDLNVYAAEIALGAVAAELRGLGAAFAVDDGSRARLAALPADAALGHIACGIGRDGRPFVTVYFDGGPP